MTPEEQAALRAPFPPELISSIPKGGLKLDYVGHADVTDRLLSVDPEWTWEPVGFDSNGTPVISNKGLWIKLTVCGVTRYGFGDAGEKNGPNAVKEMIGDAIRNAAMRFGVALDLWRKDDNPPKPPVKKEVRSDPAVLREAIDLIKSATDLAELGKAKAAIGVAKNKEQLSPGDLTTLHTAYRNREAELS